MEREKQLERKNRALQKQLDLLLDTIAKHLGDGSPLTLREAIILVEVAGWKKVDSESS